MATEYKIFFNDRLFLLTADTGDIAVEQKYRYNFENPKQIFELISTFEKQRDIPAIAVIDKDPDRVLEAMKSRVKYIVAAGGLVKNKSDRYLFIYRLCRWDLPKGKMDSGEKTNETAIREVSEETGLKKLLILREIPSTFHTFRKDDIFILKRTYWYEMITNDSEPLVPQKEENIEEARWFASSDFAVIVANTYPSVLEVMKNIPQ